MENPNITEDKKYQKNDNMRKDVKALYMLNK